MHSKKIVVIDDSRTARQQVIGALADQGYDLIEAVDGRGRPPQDRGES